MFLAAARLPAETRSDGPLSPSGNIRPRTRPSNSTLRRRIAPVRMGPSIKLPPHSPQVSNNASSSASSGGTQPDAGGAMHCTSANPHGASNEPHASNARGGGGRSQENGGSLGPSTSSFVLAPRSCFGAGSEDVDVLVDPIPLATPVVADVVDVSVCAPPSDESTPSTVRFAHAITAAPMRIDARTTGDPTRLHGLCEGGRHGHGRRRPHGATRSSCASSRFPRRHDGSVSLPA